MTITQHIKNWIKSADENMEVAESLYKLKHYDWCLFFWQLILEKYLKAILLKQNKQTLFTHDLLELAKKCDIKLSESAQQELKEISKYNTEVKYDFQKLEIYKKSTKKHADKWIKTSKGWLTFLRKQLQ